MCHSQSLYLRHCSRISKYLKLNKLIREPCIFLTFLTSIPTVRHGWWLLNKAVQWNTDSSWQFHHSSWRVAAVQQLHWAWKIVSTICSWQLHPSPSTHTRSHSILFLAQQDLSLTIEISGIGVDFILHAANTFSSLLQVRWTFQHFCLSRGAIPCSKHFGITDNSP